MALTVDSTVSTAHRTWHRPYRGPLDRPKQHSVPKGAQDPANWSLSLKSNVHHDGTVTGSLSLALPSTDSYLSRGDGEEPLNNQTLSLSTTSLGSAPGDRTQGGCAVF